MRKIFDIWVGWCGLGFWDGLNGRLNGLGWVCGLIGVSVWGLGVFGAENDLVLLGYKSMWYFLRVIEAFMTQATCSFALKALLLASLAVQ